MISDYISKGDMSVKRCPTDLMIGDYFTKPLQGKDFGELCNTILGVMTEDCDKFKLK